MEPFKDIPTYDHNTKEWSKTAFETRKDLYDFCLSIFKEPGKYEFDECSLEFNCEARKFNKTRLYCLAPFRSRDFISYWNDQKEKCREGVIYKYNGKTWYLSRDYYMWVNFLPIYNKEIAKFSFPDVRDVQYHMALYEEIAKWNFKHVAILKKRQIASSYYHAGKLINNFWFEEGSINKIAGSLKDYINEKGTWRFLEEYRNFLNEHTAWYRPCTPDKVLNWEQKIEVQAGGRKKDVGLKSVLIGLGLDKDSTKGVGGPCSIFFHEEAGIAKSMDTTVEFLLPALKSGMGYTGQFIAAGSVGDLEQCEPLREMIFNPDAKDIQAVPTNLLDANNSEGMCGLFIPEQWGMQPCIDEYGNSQVEESLKMILAERIIWLKTLKAEDYQLRISQKPINIEEAFASRKVSKFALHLVNQQLRRIENGEFPAEYVDLNRNDKGEIEITKSKRLPITEFPISPRTLDKEAVVVIYERPVKNLKLGSYYASVDPVSEGKTTTSDSLCSIVIYRPPTEVITHMNDGTVKSNIEGDKLVASWCGRFDDLNKTHERLEMMIELFQAWTIVENNISLFIQYMMHKKKQKYLVPKTQILFLKELNSNVNVFQEYGWKNTGTIFKSHLVSYGAAFVSEEIEKETEVDGTVKKITYGVERIPDPMILREMLAYRDGLNVDRLVTYCSLVSFAKVQQSARGFIKTEVLESKTTYVDKSKYAKTHSAFSNTNKGSSLKKTRTGFRNLR